MKTLIGKCCHTPNLDSMREATLEKFKESIDFVFRTEDNLNVGDVIKINRKARMGFFHIFEVRNKDCKYRHKETMEIFENLPEGANEKDYWAIPILVEGPANCIHYSHIHER